MTAVQTTGGGGYGLGFLSFLKSPAWGIDYGQNGATTVSYVQGGVQGNWTAVMEALDDAKDEYEVFVPIMVGWILYLPGSLGYGSEMWTLKC